ncbi:MAG: response regulator transcription factor [Campylobacteraceae bacterium]|jgi:DNA-binding response OmpR family regulator|nr:response regulator transcription factor [Campylobacteraceae bacterium]
MTSGVLEKLSVLYVEDEADIRKSLTNAVQGEFKAFLTAADGSEGLKKFKKYKPDIVITDLLMPIQDGLSLAREIKSISKDTLIIVLSAFSEKEKLLGAIDAGVDKYLIKPIYPDELLSLISELAQQKILSDNTVDLGGGYEFDKNRKALIKDGAKIVLTKKEIAFISFLAERLDFFGSHEEIRRHIWGQKPNDAAIRTFIKRIREKTHKDFIKNVPALGYKIFTTQ